jgi:hypothetical protein
MVSKGHGIEGVRDSLTPDGAVTDFEGFPVVEGRDAFVAMMDKFGG